MAYLLSEATADGERYYLVAGPNAAKRLQHLLDLELGSPHEVEHWGGWGFNCNPFAEFDDTYEWNQTPVKHIEKLIADGGRVAAVAEIENMITRNTMSAYQKFQVTDEVWKIIRVLEAVQMAANGVRVCPHCGK